MIGFFTEGLKTMSSKLPLPSEITNLRFLRGDTYAVLEFNTVANPIRVFLSRDQLEHLARYARITLAKIESDERIY
jgi:hypothetical protein